MTYGICGLYGIFAATMLILFIKEPERGRYDVKKEVIEEAIKEDEEEEEKQK